MLAGVLALGTALPAFADGPFTELGRFDGRLGAMNTETGPIVPGSTATIAGRGLQPGQEITLRQSGSVLNGDAPLVAGDDGSFSFDVAIPQDATSGAYPVVVELANPSYATTFDLRVAPDLGDIGQDDYTVEGRPLVPGLYQVAESPALGAVFVTSSVGRPPVHESQLVKLDADTLEVVAATTPPEASNGVYAVYGVGIDAERSQVWVTNTRQNTVAVYAADDLSLVKQFPDGLVSHARDVVVHDGKAYASATFTPNIEVFDAETLEHVQTIALQSGQRGEDFGASSIALDPEAGVLMVASLTTNEVGVIDLNTGEQTAVWQVPGADRVIGIAFDPARGHVYTANAGSDDVSILDADSGELVTSVPVGSSPLNVTVEPESGTVFVAIRNSGTVVALSPEGEVLANLPIGSFPNHLTVDQDGGVLVVNKARGSEDPTGDHLTRITPNM